MKRSMIMAVLVAAALPATAAPQVSGDGACGLRAVDNAAFLTCDGDRAPEAAGVDTSLPAALPITARQAWALKREMGSRVLLVDIRSRPEVLLTGMALGVEAHVPFMQPEPGWPLDATNGQARMTFDYQYLRHMDDRLAAAGLRHGDPVVLLCRSGERSRLAAELMREHGYLQVFAVTDGFEGHDVDDGAGRFRREGGWKQAGLPWTPRVDAGWLSGDAPSP